MFVRKTQTLLVASAIAAVSGIALAQDGPAANMSFFLTSVGSGDGGNLGGLAGADAHCTALAADVGACDKTWRA